MTIDTDEEIRAEFNQGRLSHAGLRIAFRQMKALERVADSLEKLVERFVRPPAFSTLLKPKDREPETPPFKMSSESAPEAVAAQEEPLSVEDL